MKAVRPVFSTPSKAPVSKRVLFIKLDQYNKNVPGPGTYSDKPNQLSSTGIYFNSKFENSKVRSFSHTDKNFGLGGIYQNCKEAGNHLNILKSILYRKSSWPRKL
jgi:hypothetical protein